MSIHIWVHAFTLFMGAVTLGGALARDDGPYILIGLATTALGVVGLAVS